MPDAAPPAADPAAREAQPLLPWWLRLRLTVAIPLVVTSLVAASGLLGLGISYPLFFRTGRALTVVQVESRVAMAFTAVVGFALLCLLAAMLFARAIARPLRALTSRVQSLQSTAGARDGPRSDFTELDALGSALDGVEHSVSSLRLDSYTLRSLEGGVITVDREGVITSFSAVAETILGSRGERVVGRPFAELAPDEEPNGPFLRAVRAVLGGGPRVSSAEAMVRTTAGRTVQLGYCLSPLRDERGRPLGIVLTFKDLAEQKVTEQRIRRTETLALIGTMATNVAHEINNPLAAMSGYVEMIRSSRPDDPETQDFTTEMLESIERISRTCQELLTVGSPEPRNVGPVDINELARRTLAFVRHDGATEGVEVHAHYDPDLPPVPGDGERLGQVLLNILRNAYQACRDGGEITLATRTTDTGVALAVTNTGPRIPPERLDKLFDIFYTTKPRGTGVGLAISQQLVRAHGGRILVQSAAQTGTVFTIELPLVDSPLAAEA